MNAGLALASGEYVFIGDADGVPEPDALLLTVNAFIEDKNRDVIAVGGTVLPSNSCTIVDGTVTASRVPRRMLARFQLVEYLRAFLLTRPGIAKVGGLPIVSGAFGMFRRDDLRDIHGFQHHHLGEDMDATVRLADHFREQRGDDVLPFVKQVPHAILWTQVPDTLSVLRRQRVRWASGLNRIMHDHARLFLHPKKSGTLALVGLSWMGIVEVVAPLMEVLGIVLSIQLVLYQVVPISWVWLVLILNYGISITSSLCALWFQERFLKQYPARRESWRMLTAVLLEPLFYHTLITLWRLESFIPKKSRGWGDMPRTANRTAETAGGATLATATATENFATTPSNAVSPDADDIIASL